MALDPDQFRALTTAAPADAWRAIIDDILSVCVQPLSAPDRKSVV